MCFCILSLKKMHFSAILSFKWPSLGYFFDIGPHKYGSINIFKWLAIEFYEITTVTLKKKYQRFVFDVMPIKQYIHTYSDANFVGGNSLCLRIMQGLKYRGRKYSFHCCLALICFSLVKNHIWEKKLQNFNHFFWERLPKRKPQIQ